MTSSGLDKTHEGKDLVPHEIEPGLVHYLTETAQIISNELGYRNGCLMAAHAQRMAAMEPEHRLGLAPSLHPRPDIVSAPRFQILSGEISSGEGAVSPEQFFSLVSIPNKKLPPLKVPEGYDDETMDLANRLQLLGNGPDIFSRERAASGELPIKPDIILIHGGANKAPYERLTTALVVAEASGFDGPIVAMASNRKISDAERNNVKGFYFPEGEEIKLRREQELVRAAALKLGFEVVVPEDQLGELVTTDQNVQVLKMRNPDGRELRIITPPEKPDSTGLQNGLMALELEPEIAAVEEFSSKSIVHITSTHYGMMALFNAAEAQNNMCAVFGSQVVVGDNQPSRTPDAHLHEIGFGINKIADLVEAYPGLKNILFPPTEA